MRIIIELIVVEKKNFVNKFGQLHPIPDFYSIKLIIQLI